MKNTIPPTTPTTPTWMEIIAKYNKPDRLKSIWQIINSVVPYVLLWGLMIKSLEITYWLTLLLSIPTAGFLVRIFIIFHDCVHGAFFKTQKWNTLLGVPLGIMVFTPFHRWQNDHLIHHRTVGNLDKRGIGDVKTLTVKEYLKLSKWQRIGYRLYRHPIFLFAIAPLLQFLLHYRFSHHHMSWQIKKTIYITNLVIGTKIVILGTLLGWETYVLIQLPIIFLATTHGLWLFYVQHQFENVIWQRTANWDYKTVALQGSSYFKLPGLLRWFTGNIGFHHIHHLSPQIPNYNLRKCQKENTLFHEVKPLTFLTAFKSMLLRLWDESQQKLISFKEIRK